MKKILFATIFSVGFMAAAPVMAQSTFWAFDENNREATIPPQCDGQFDEARGGVFMPTPEELFDYGEAFLVEKGPTRSNAGYCLLAAALQGHVEAQYRLAQLYNKGIVMPQNDLVAYKWAFIASMNGHKEAEQLALMMEQFLSAEDIRLATASIQGLLPDMMAEKKQTLAEQEKVLEEKQIELEKINAEIDSMLGVHFKSDVLPGQAKKEKPDEAKDGKDNKGTATKQNNEPQVLNPGGSMFSDKDRVGLP